MIEATSDLSEAIKRQAEIILHMIESSGSMILAVKSGARAQGFMQGIICCEGLSLERCELLSSHFDSAVEKRLKAIDNRSLKPAKLSFAESYLENQDEVLHFSFGTCAGCQLQVGGHS